MVACLAAIAGFAVRARAASACRAPGAPAVRVVFSGEAWEDALARGVLEHLRAGLSPQGFSVCSEADLPNEADAVATIELRRTGGERIAATIEVRDGVTEKRVARDIDLSALPPDGRALGVGVAADELLRASWIELSLADAPKPKRPPPEAAMRSVDRSLGRSESRSLVSVSFATEAYSGSFVLLGGELGFRRYVVPRFAVEVGLGVAEARPYPSAHGTIRGSALSASASGVFDPIRAGGFRASLAVTAFVANVDARGTPTDGGTGRRDSAIAVFARGGIALSFDLSPSFAVLGRAGVGLPVRAVTADDSGRSAAGASGVEWSAALGPAVVF